jgi:hypothetical protein
MTDTTLELFNNVSLVSTGDALWQDEDNVKAEAGIAFANNFGVGQTNRLQPYTPIAGAFVPTSADITDIRIDVNWRVTGLATASGSVYLISSSTKLDGVSGSLDTYTFEGDLAYWGLTQQQARDFANGTRPLVTFMTEGGGNVDQYQMAWAKARFTYDGGSSSAPPMF